MLTDDDLARELGGAFRADTDDLRYAGRVPTPRTGPGLAVPIATTALAATALAGVWAVAPDESQPAPPPSAGTRPTPSPSLVTSTIEVAGYTFSYRHAADEPGVLYAVADPGPAPADARPIEAPEGIRAWVGTDPASGDTALWVQAPTRNEGRLFALMSPTWTAAELTDLFHHGSPRPVPMVSR